MPNHFVVVEWNGYDYDDSEENVVGVFDQLHHAIEFIHNAAPVRRYNNPLPKLQTHTIHEWYDSQNVQSYYCDGSRR